MKILVLFGLILSFAIFAKPNINYNYIPDNSNIIAYISTRNLMKSDFYKKALKTQEGREVIKKFKQMGIDIKKLGSVFAFSSIDKVLKNNRPEENIKKADYAIIINGLSFEKAIQTVAKAEKSKLKTSNYKGIKVYEDVKRLDDIEAIAFLKTDSILGSLSGVKKSIDSFKGKSRFKNKKIIKNLYSKLGSPDIFVFNLITPNQKVVIDAMVLKNQTNPMFAMLGIPTLTKTLKTLGFTVKLKGDIAIMKIMVEANKTDTKTFINLLNQQFTQFKPMIMQQVAVYGQMLGEDGSKELKSVINSIKIINKKNLGIISFKVNLKNVEKIMKKANSAPYPNDNKDEILKGIRNNKRGK